MDEYQYEYDELAYGGDEDDDGGDDLPHEHFYHDYKTFEETWNSCVIPSFTEIIAYIATFFLWNCIYAITTQTGIDKYKERHHHKLTNRQF